MPQSVSQPSVRTASPLDQINLGPDRSRHAVGRDKSGRVEARTLRGCVEMTVIGRVGGRAKVLAMHCSCGQSLPSYPVSAVRPSPPPPPTHTHTHICRTGLAADRPRMPPTRRAAPILAAMSHASLSRQLDRKRPRAGHNCSPAANGSRRHRPQQQNSDINCATCRSWC